MVLSKQLFTRKLTAGLLMAIFCWSCDSNPGTSENEEQNFQEWNSLVVTASAYNSLHGQAEGDPSITFWGDTLEPGMKSIAVSHDLLNKGLSYSSLVKIEGLDGLYVVNDKMHARWRNKIDIYMGVDREKALEWGRKKVEICFPSEEAVENDDSQNDEIGK